MRSRAMVAAASALVSAGVAAGSVQLVSQTRSVSAGVTSAGVAPPLTTRTAPNDLPWTDSISDLLTGEPGGPQGSADVEAFHQSSLSVGGTEALLSGVVAVAQTAIGPGFRAQAAARFEVTFDVVADPALYVFSTTRSVAGLASYSAVLTGPGGTVFNPATPVTGIFGVLDPGRYTVVIQADTPAAQDSVAAASGAFSLRLGPVPSPGAAGLAGAALLASSRRRRA